MSDQNSSYNQIFKATSLFGGVQVITVMISIIRSKFIAILLGPTGIGISGLLSSTILFITTLTDFGIERSAVKNVAEAHSSENENKISRIVKIVRKLVWYTGLLGVLITLIFSSFLSKITFGNEDYTFGFMLLSITLLVNQLTAGKKVILRGMRKLIYVAKSTLWGAIFGLCISIPIYYVWGIKGIVPAILVTSISTFLAINYFSNKVIVKNVKINNRDIILEGKELLSMGFFLSLNSLIVLGASYLVRLYIRYEGNIEDVGFYNAGFAIVNSYFGMIFSALTTDYYPRLAGVASNNKKASLLINQQSEMTILIIAPMLTVFIVFVNFLIIILYSKEFLPIAEMMIWAGFGIYFKAVSWALGVIFISKGDVKTLFFSELVATSVMLSLNLSGYKLLGLEGLGISFLLAYLYAFIQNFVVLRYKYSFAYSSNFYKVFLSQLVLGVLCLFTVEFIAGFWSYIIGSLLIIFSLLLSLKILNQKTDLLSKVIEKYKK